VQRVIRPWRDDASHAYPSIGLTPGRALALLHAADSGTPQLQFELFHEMLQKWPRLAAVEATRRLALTGLEWEIAPAEAQGAGAAIPEPRAVADYCRQSLDALEGLREALNHLALAIGYGLAVAEIVWDGSRLVDVVPVPYSRLLSDPHEPWRLRIRTAEDPVDGVPLDEFPHKWVVHRPNALPGRHFEGGLLRASVLLYVASNLSFKDWLIYSQIAGMPVRIAQFEPGTPEADQMQLLDLLEHLGTDAVAAFSKSVDLKFVDAARAGDRPYQPIQDYCNTEITILWLGQHLTTDLRNSGSRAAAEIHDRVREDLLVDDLAAEAQALRRDLLKPLVWARFGERVPVPHFRGSLIQSVDTKVLADTLAVAVNELALPVARSWAHRALGIPVPQANEPLLAGRDLQ